MKCIGVYKGYRLYHDLKHDDFLLMNPNYRFNRRFEHCKDEDVVKWARNLEDKIRENPIKHREC